MDEMLYLCHRNKKKSKNRHEESYDISNECHPIGQ